MSLSDQALLGTDTGFVARVKAAMIGGALTLKDETSSTPNHYRRVSFASLLLNNPDAYGNLFARSVATNSSVISDATQGSTVVLTTGNLAAQAALVTDGHILAALNVQIDCYYSPF